MGALVYTPSESECAPDRFAVATHGINFYGTSQDCSIMNESSNFVDIYGCAMTQTALITGCSCGFGKLPARTFQCVSGDATINSSTGADTEMLIAMMAQNKREAV